MTDCKKEGFIRIGFQIFIFENFMILISSLQHSDLCGILIENIVKICDDFIFVTLWFKMPLIKDEEATGPIEIPKKAFKILLMPGNDQIGEPW